MKQASFIVDGDTFETIRFPDVSPTEKHEKILNGFLNNPTAVDVTDSLDVAIGWTHSDGVFSAGETGQSALAFFEQTGVERDPDSSYFAFLSDDEVFTFIVLKNTDTKHDMYKAAFATGVTIVVEDI